MFDGNEAVCDICQTRHELEMQVVPTFSITSWYISLHYIIPLQRIVFAAVAVIKKKKKKCAQYENHREQEMQMAVPTTNDSKAWQVVQDPTGTHIPLVKQCGL